VGLARPSRFSKKPDSGDKKKINNTDLSNQTDGATRNFTTPDKYESGSLKLYVNGLRQMTGLNFTETSTTTFLTSFAPLAIDYIEVDYDLL